MQTCFNLVKACGRRQKTTISFCMFFVLIFFMPQIARLKAELKSCPYKEAKCHHQSSCYLCGLLIVCFCFMGFLRWVVEIQTGLWAWSKLQMWFHIPEFNEFSHCPWIRKRFGLGKERRRTFTEIFLPNKDHGGKNDTNCRVQLENLCTAGSLSFLWWRQSV